MGEPLLEQHHPILFLDIPKTGGTRLKVALDELTGPRLTVGEWTQLSELSDEELARYNLITGFFHAYQMSRPLFASFLKVTVLRDPLERFIGFYEFARQQGLRNQGGARQRFAAQVPIFEYFMSPAGVAHRHAQLYVLGLDPGEEAHAVPLHVLLDRAKRRLAAMVVAVVPRLAEVVAALSAQFGIAPGVLPQDLDAVSNPIDTGGASADEIVMMREVLSVDMALHAFASERCEAFISDPKVSPLPPEPEPLSAAPMPTVMPND